MKLDMVKLLSLCKHQVKVVITDMQNENGGFSSTIDADSEGKEGKYYVWSDEELGNIVKNKEALANPEVLIQYKNLKELNH